METTTLDSLLHTGQVNLHPRGLEISIPSTWVVSGENRLSYTTLTRLVECCREHHWKKDIERVGESIDSTIKIFSAQFDFPIFMDTVIDIVYTVGKIGKSSYELLFEIRDQRTCRVCARYNLLLVFIDPIKNCSVTPSHHIKQLLAQLQQSQT